MKFTVTEIDSLRREVEGRLSQKRFEHTLGVEKMAEHIAEKVMPDRVDEIRVAALLHDISKEYSEAEQLEIAKDYGLTIGDEEINTPALWHSITAPGVVLRDFSHYASEDVLSAVYNHTVGAADMTVFDEIILLADYIEEGRKYDRCIALRESFCAEIERCRDNNAAVLVLHRAVYQSLENNIQEFISKGVDFHSRTKTSRDAVLAKIERFNMENIRDLVGCDSGTLAREAVKLLLEKKAVNVALFDVREKSSITDYYINVTGRSATQVAALADEVDAKMSERGRAAIRTEGKRGNGWILVDFGDLIINVFDRASREFYNLDRHFPEESRLDISDLVSEVDKKFEIKNIEE